MHSRVHRYGVFLNFVHIPAAIWCCSPKWLDLYAESSKFGGCLQTSVMKQICSCGFSGKRNWCPRDSSEAVQGSKWAAQCEDPYALNQHERDSLIVPGDYGCHKWQNDGKALETYLVRAMPGLHGSHYGSPEGLEQQRQAKYAMKPRLTVHCPSCVKYRTACAGTITALGVSKKKIIWSLVK